MPSDYERHLARMRGASRQREELFLVRYSSGPPAVALQLAQRWRQALSSEPLDWAELSTIREDAQKHKATADVAFFYFINELDADYSMLRRTELET